MMKNSNNTLVYSTDPAPSTSKTSKATPSATEKGGGKKSVRLSIERKGRGGKTVTVIDGLEGSPHELADLVSRLKKSCGTGGTFKGGTAEIQGDHRALLTTQLKSFGYEVKGGIS